MDPELESLLKQLYYIELRIASLEYSDFNKKLHKELLGNQQEIVVQINEWSKNNISL